MPFCIASFDIEFEFVACNVAGSFVKSFCDWMIAVIEELLHLISASIADEVFGGDNI